MGLVPGLVGIGGIEKADAAAKMATEREPTLIPISYGNYYKSPVQILHSLLNEGWKRSVVKMLVVREEVGDWKKCRIAENCKL